jgi:hypothetical protein
MIRHVVLFRFRAGLSVDLRAGFDEAAHGLAGDIPAVSALLGGPSLGLQAGGFDYTLMLDFSDRAAFDAYKSHPAHARFIADHVRPCVEESVRAQVAL